MNVNGLPTRAPPIVKLSLIWNVVVVVNGALTTKLNVEPLFVVASTPTPDPLGPYVGVAKSKLTPFVAPTALRTVTVQLIASPTRTTVVDKLACPVHDNVDETVGIPTTANTNELLVRMAPALSFSVMANVVVTTLGAVTTKLKLAPPLPVTRDPIPLPLGPYVGTAKSDANPVVAANALRTFTVHEIISLIRTYVVDVDVDPAHDKVDDAVGTPYTAKLNALPVIEPPPLSDSLM